MLDTKALAQATAAIVRDHVDAATTPLIARIAELEAAQSRTLRISISDVDGFEARVREVAAEVSIATVAALPTPRDGKDADLEALREVVDSVLAETTPQIMADLAALIPPPIPGEKGDPGDRGEQGEAGRDGVGLAGMMIDRDGEAIATLTDGKMIKLGLVVGRDGKDGAPGAPGQDGRDGKDLDDIVVTQDGSKIEFAFQIGETRSLYEIELPEGPAGADGQDAYPGEAKGLYDPGASYRKLDVVSFNGSEWRAKQDDPGELPGAGWMLSACKGKRGDRGERGLSGKDGISPVALYVRGTELVTTLSDGAELTADLSQIEQHQA